MGLASGALTALHAEVHVDVRLHWHQWKLRSTADADTTLSWLVLPEIVGKDTVASTYVSLDLLLDDGQRVSASSSVRRLGSACRSAGS